MGILGTLGSGKTCGMTYLAYLNFLKGRQIYSNYGIRLPNVIRVNSPEDVLNMADGFAALDEKH